MKAVVGDMRSFHFLRKRGAEQSFTTPEHISEWYVRILDISRLNSKVHGQWLAMIISTFTWADIFECSQDTHRSEILGRVYAITGIVHKYVRIY